MKMLAERPCGLTLCALTTTFPPDRQAPGSLRISGAEEGPHVTPSAAKLKGWTGLTTREELAEEALVLLQGAELGGAVQGVAEALLEAGVEPPGALEVGEGGRLVAGEVLEEGEVQDGVRQARAVALGRPRRGQGAGEGVLLR